MASRQTAMAIWRRLVAVRRTPVSRKCLTNWERVSLTMHLKVSDVQSRPPTNLFSNEG